MLKKIPISDLFVDMYIAEIIAEEGEPTPKKKQGMVREQRIISKFIELGIKYVVVDTEKGLDPADVKRVTETEEESDVHHHSILDLELQAILDELLKNTNTHYQDLSLEWNTAKEIFKTSESILERTVGSLRIGDDLNIEHFVQAAKAISRSIMRNKDALTWLGKIRDQDLYLYEHSVNTAILMGVFGHAYGLNVLQVEHCVIGALLHDLGQAKIRKELFLRAGPLTVDEYEEVKTHVKFGVRLATTQSNIPDIALQIIHQHHERRDGSGYPNGLKLNEISLYARMFSIVDTYDAVTNNRAYREAVPSSFGMRTLLESCHSHFEETLVHQFIKCMGVYPTGSLVKLNNGFLAVVIAQNPKLPLKPLVKTVFNTKNNCFLEPRMLDLSRPNNDEKIVTYEDARKFGININEFMPVEIDF